jgi:hypothetical protein
MLRRMRRLLGAYSGREGLQRSFQTSGTNDVVSLILRLLVFKEQLTNKFGGMPWGRMMCRILCQDQRENQF